VTSRDTILAAVRANQPTPAPPLPEIPLFEKTSGSLLEQFREALLRMGGKFPERPNAENPDRFIRSLFPQAQVICSATPEVIGTQALSGGCEPADLADVDVGIVRAAFGVAETGSIWLSEQELRVNALAYLAQHLVALLDPADIVGNLHHAYRDPRFKTARYAVLVTGPSATADIEGVLIQGAQGVRSMTVLLVPRSQSRMPAADKVLTPPRGL
jgi:L-lactate dehydrogenase complex protein LldG